MSSPTPGGFCAPAVPSLVSFRGPRHNGCGTVLQRDDNPGWPGSCSPVDAAASTPDHFTGTPSENGATMACLTDLASSELLVRSTVGWRGLHQGADVAQTQRRWQPGSPHSFEPERPAKSHRAAVSSANCCSCRCGFVGFRIFFETFAVKYRTFSSGDAAGALSWPRQPSPATARVYP